MNSITPQLSAHRHPLHRNKPGQCLNCKLWDLMLGSWPKHILYIHNLLLTPWFKLTRPLQHLNPIHLKNLFPILHYKVHCQIILCNILLFVIDLKIIPWICIIHFESKNDCFEDIVGGRNIWYFAGFGGWTRWNIFNILKIYFIAIT